MKSKTVLLITLLTLVLLACNCNTLTLPFNRPTSTPTSSLTQPPASPQVTTPAPRPPVSTDEAPFDIPWDDYTLFKKNLAASAQGILTKLPGASIYHIAFSLSAPPTSVLGVEEVRYTNQENVALTEVDFAIFSEILGGSIHINNILLDGQPVTPQYSPGLIRVPLPAPLQPGQSVIFHVEFEVGVPTRGGDYYYGIFGYNDGTLSLAHAYPTILVYNEAGWNNQTPDLDGDPLFSDTSFYLVSVDAPADLALVASGVEVGRSETAGRQKVLYADGPARDFYLAASADFVKQSDKVGKITYNSYAPVDLSQYAKSALHNAEAAIKDFSQRYGPYPYTEFDIVPIITSAGGVEFPGMTAIAEDAYSAGNFLEIVVAHEVSHQWFYNLVGNETQNQPWLDESLAEFSTCQYFRDRHGSQAGQSCQQEMQANWDIVDDENIPIGMAVSGYTSDGYVAIIYGRGELFFQALKQQIGEATFDSLMRDYVQTFAWKIATTDSFKQLAEQHCNCDLTPLFDQWVYP
jgi:hypothetical protein